jgi:excinuclease ABC subunit C
MAGGFQFNPAEYPTDPGVYLFRDAAGIVLYVGKAVNLRQRLRSYAAGGDGRAQIPAMLRRAAALEVILTGSEVEALVLENNLIKEHRPRYNIFLRDDKSYPFIRITREPFPRLLLTRRVERDGSRYFGPYTEVRILRGFLKGLRERLRIRQCDLAISEESIAQGRHKVCLDYHLGVCRGPCAGLQDEGDYADAIDLAAGLLKGRGRQWRRDEERRMLEASARLDFEEAARRRDAVQALDQLIEGQRVELQEVGDADVVGLACADNEAAVALLKVRDGRVLGRFHSTLAGALEQETGELLRVFLSQYYAQCEELPGEIWLGEEPRERPLLEAWLAGRARQLDESGPAPRLLVPRRGERRALLRMAVRNAAQVLEERALRRLRRERVPQSLLALQRDLGLPELPRRIEGFDISHFGGAATVASLVVFQDGRPLKRQYRHFNVKTVEGIDDFAAMEEIVERRYRRVQAEGGALPDLVLIDGGKGQLGRACAALRRLGLGELPVCGLAKRFEEVFLPGESLPRNIPRDSAANRLLQQVRDEAHRFALRFNRHQMARLALPDPLAAVPGVGPELSERLLLRFGGLRRLARAGREELLEVKGVGPMLADRIIDVLRPGQAEAHPGGGELS